MLLRDRKAERVGELVGDHVNFPAIDLHAACERISRKKKKKGGRTKRMGYHEWMASIRGENFTGGGGRYLALTYRKGSGVRPAQLIHRPIDT